MRKIIVILLFVGLGCYSAAQPLQTAPGEYMFVGDVNVGSTFNYADSCTTVFMKNQRVVLTPKLFGIGDDFYPIEEVIQHSYNNTQWFVVDTKNGGRFRVIFEKNMLNLVVHQLKHLETTYRYEKDIDSIINNYRVSSCLEGR